MLERLRELGVQLSRSTTSAPATRRWPISSASASPGSRSTSPSSTTSAADPDVARDRAGDHPARERPAVRHHRRRRGDRRQQLDYLAVQRLPRRRRASCSAAPVPSLELSDRLRREPAVSRLSPYARPRSRTAAPARRVPARRAGGRAGSRARVGPASRLLAGLADGGVRAQQRQRLAMLGIVGQRTAEEVLKSGIGRVARSSGRSVPPASGCPRARSVPGVLPDCIDSDVMSTRSSASWKATPIRSPNWVSVSTSARRRARP